MFSEKEVVPHRLVQIARLSEAVKAEFDLVGTRMSWLVTSQAFLFAAFATAAANLKSGSDLELCVTLRTLIVILPVMGAIFSALVALALRAAHKVTVGLKDDRDALISKLPEELRINLVSSRVDEHVFGNLPACFIPWILFAAWLVVFSSLYWSSWFK